MTGSKARSETSALLHGLGFAALYERHADSLLGYFMRRVYDHHAALDLTAETFAQILLSRRRFRGTTEAELDAWMFAIARTQLARYARKGRAERKAIKRLAVQVPELTDDDLTRIDELADLERLRDSIEGALTDLSEDQRKAIELRVIEELSYAEVAQRLDISEATARARVSRALRRLAVRLNPTPIQEARR